MPSWLNCFAQLFVCDFVFVCLLFLLPINGLELFHVSPKIKAKLQMDFLPHLGGHVVGWREVTPFHSHSPLSGGHTERHFRVELTDGESQKGTSHGPDSGKLDRSITRGCGDSLKLRTEL